MKNRKGFTLVEVLAVILILAIVMIIAIPAIGNALGAGKDKIKEINKKQIKEAVEVLVTEVVSCDVSDKTYAAFGISGSNCSALQNSIVGKTINVSIDNLKNNGYLKDDSANCTGSINVTVNANNYQITIDDTNLKCK